MNLMVARTLSVLELFAAQKRPLSTTEIANLLHLPASSCHDVVRVLEARGYLYRTSPRACWYPTSRLLEVTTTIVANDVVLARMLGPLRKLRDTIDESVLLAKVDGLQAMYLLALEPSHALRYLITIGERVRDLHATSTGNDLPGSVSAEESEPGLTTLSSRFTWRMATYSVTVAGPTRRLQPRLSEACRLLTQTCRELQTPV